jgi:hypothetical protein
MLTWFRRLIFWFTPVLVAQLCTLVVGIGVDGFGLWRAFAFGFKWYLKSALQVFVELRDTQRSRRVLWKVVPLP